MYVHIMANSKVNHVAICSIISHKYESAKYYSSNHSYRAKHHLQNVFVSISVAYKINLYD
jgi:hypothetical protein